MRTYSQHAAQKFLPTHRGETKKDGRLAICLAGAGFRAAAFALGACRRWNELGLLSRANAFSACGGGSLVAAALARAWPELRCDEYGVFANFDQLVRQPLEKFLAVPLRLARPWWDRLVGRGPGNEADLFARCLDRKLCRGWTLRMLPVEPRFVFQAVNLRTGGLWLLERLRVGEPLLGHVADPKLRLAEAVAASAAHPLYFPPLERTFAPEEYLHGQLGPRGDSLRRRVALADGAVADNLAVESVWRDYPTLLVCDGGQEVPLEPNYTDWLGPRLVRSFAVAQDYGLAARKRWLIQGYVAGMFDGAYVGLPAYHGHYGLAGSVGYPADVVEELRRMRVDMAGLTDEETQALLNHGCTLADAAVRRYCPARVRVDAPLALPCPDLVDRNRVLTALDDGVRAAA